MNKTMIKDIVKIKQFEPVIETDWIATDYVDSDKAQRLTVDYCLTEELSSLFEKILEKFALKRATNSKLVGYFDISQLQQASFITGSYGTGKSYFLLMIISILKSLKDEEKNTKMLEKFSKFPAIIEHLQELKGKKYLIVTVNGQGKGGFINLRDFILHELQKEYKAEFNEDLFLKTEFDATIEAIEEYEDNFLRIYESGLPKGVTLKDLLAGLKNRNRKSLDIHYETFQKITKHEASKSSFDFEKSLIETANHLKKDKKYDGLVIVFDEFSQYFSASVETRTWQIDRGDFQALGNKVCNDLRNGVWFIGAKHEDLRSIGNLQENDLNKLNQVLGRFDDIDMPKVNPEELISGVFEVNTERVKMFARDTAPGEKELLSISNKYNTDYKFYFPLHPTVVHYLPILSSKLAASDRTTFKFISEEVKNKKLEEPIQNGKLLNLVTLVDVFDYFKSKTNAEIQHAIALLENRFRDKPLAIKIGKLLAGLFIALSTGDDSENMDYALTPGEIATFINYNNVEDVISTLTKMEEEKYPYVQRDVNNKYSFSHQPIPDTKEIIEKHYSGINEGQVFTSMLVNAKENSQIASKQTIEPSNEANIRVTRTFRCITISPEQFLRGNISADKDYDGTMYVILPTLLTNYNDILKDKIREQAVKFAKNNIVISYFKSMDMLSKEDFKWLGAAKKALSEINIEENQLFYRTLSREISDMEKRINGKLSDFLDIRNLDFVTEVDLPKRIINTKRVFEKVLVNYYNKFPEFKRESITRVAVNSIFKRIDSNPMQITTNINASGQIEGKFGHLKLTLGEDGFGLVKFELVDDEFVGTLCEPSNTKPELKNSREIWDIIYNGQTEEERRQGKKGSFTPITKSISSVYETLKQAPYGLSDELIELYIGIGVYMKKIAIYERGTNIAVLPHIKGLSDFSKQTDRKYVVKEVPRPSKNLLIFWKNIWRFIDEGLANDHYQAILTNQLFEIEEAWTNFTNDLNYYSNYKVIPIIKKLEDLSINTSSFLEHNTLLVQIKNHDSSADGLEYLSELVDIDNTDKLQQMLENIRITVEKIFNLEKEIDSLSTLLRLYPKLKEEVRKYNPKAYSNTLSEADNLYNKIHEQISFDEVTRIYSLFSQLWSAYISEIDSLHKVLSDIREQLGKKELNSNEFYYYEAISEFPINDLHKASEFKGFYIDSEQKKVCKNNIQQDLKDWKKVKDIKCIRCQKTISSLSDEILETQDKERKISDILKQNIIAWNNKVINFNDIRNSTGKSFETYLETNNLNTKLKTWNKILEICKTQSYTQHEELRKEISSIQKDIKDFKAEKGTIIRETPDPTITYTLKTVINQLEKDLIIIPQNKVTVDELNQKISKIIKDKFSNGKIIIRD